MSSLAFPSENHAELPSPDSCHDSSISRPRYVVLQSLIGIMLAYQLLSGTELVASHLTSEVIVGGLAAMVLCLLWVPTSILQATWFSGTLIGIDTIFVTATIYLSGNARSDLYLSYFMLMLIAASVRRLSHVIAFSLALYRLRRHPLSRDRTNRFFVGRAFAGSTGSVGDGDVLRDRAANDRGRTATKNTIMLESIEALKETEEALQASRDHLEIRMKGLKNDLSRANEHVRQEKQERQGLEQQLHEAQKMEALGRIAGGIANELSHLVSVIGRQTGVVLSRLKPTTRCTGRSMTSFERRAGLSLDRSIGWVGSS